MLSQHNPQVRRRMTVDDFVRNNRGINDKADFPREYLEAIYHAIKRCALALPLACCSCVSMCVWVATHVPCRRPWGSWESDACARALPVARPICAGVCARGCAVSASS
jgi:hypothetical protein